MTKSYTKYKSRISTIISEKDIVIAICVDGKPPQLFEKSAVPFLSDLKYRRSQFDLLQANSHTNT